MTEDIRVGRGSIFLHPTQPNPPYYLLLLWTQPNSKIETDSRSKAYLDPILSRVDVTF